MIIYRNKKYLKSHTKIGWTKTINSTINLYITNNWKIKVKRLEISKIKVRQTKIMNSAINIYIPHDCNINVKSDNKEHVYWDLLKTRCFWKYFF